MADSSDNPGTTVRWLDAFPWIEAVAREEGSPLTEQSWWLAPIGERRSPERDRRLSAISELAMRRLSRWTFGEIFPGLPAGVDLTKLGLPTRARTVFGQHGCLLAGDLLGLALSDVLGWKHLGVGSMDAVLCALADEATTPSPVAVPRALGRISRSAPVAIQPDSGIGWALAGQVVDDLRTVASWFVTLGVPDRLVFTGDLGPGTPEEVLQARQRLERVAAHQLVTDTQAEHDAAVLLELGVSSLDDRVQEVLALRLFSDDPHTLDQLGRALDITRERVRQIEARARASLLELIEPQGPLDDVANAARRVIGTVLPLNKLLELIPSLAQPVPSVGQPAWRVLDRIDDAYEIADGWCASPTVQGAQTETHLRLVELANTHGAVTLADFGFLNRNLTEEENPPALVAWLQYCGYTVDGDFVYTRVASIGDRAAAVLSVVGAPLSSEELLQRGGVERSIGSLRNQLGTDPRFEKTDRDRWALVEWGLDSYTGVRALIGQELDRAGGAIPLDQLVSRITGAYSVKASSVIAYASAAPFQAKGGVVRRADTHATPRKSPERTRRLYRRDGSWVYRLRVSNDHLRGIGPAAPVAVAQLVGLQHSQTCLLDSRLGPFPMYWNALQPSFSSIRRFLLEQDVEIDREVLLVLGDGGSFDLQLVPVLSGDPLTDALLLIGADGNEPSPRAALARAIGMPESSPESSVIGAYEERGDSDVVALLLAARSELAQDNVVVRQGPTAEIDEILELL